MNRILTFVFVLISFAVQAQERIVTGHVSDASGSPIPFVSVIIKGERSGTSADAVGNYSIRVPRRPVSLIFAAVGYDTKEIAVSDTTSSVYVALNSNSGQMEEVVVVTTALGVSRNGGVRIRGTASLKSSGTNINGKVPEKIENTESYKQITENPFKLTGCEPISTFAADIDRASYSNVRSFLKEKRLPPADAVKVEEMINYFDYDYPAPSSKEPYSIYTELTECPWNTKHQLMRVALKCKTNSISEKQPANLVFLVDVSGSMQGADRLGLVVESFKLLLDSLSPNDHVAIVTYAGKPGLALESTPVSEKEKILKVLENLTAGGSTAGGKGIELAYETARQDFIEGGNNRVILATDGDFNVGVTSYSELERMIEEEKEGGIFLTCLGFGRGNYKDDIMEVLADKGNGNYYYIDQLSEAKRVLQKEFRGTLNVIAKDVKLQAEFNPRFVSSYRLIGYENRLLNKEDFDNDAKDAGELGEGHTLTALYEIVPVGNKEQYADSLNCNKNLFSPESNELAVIRTRYKNPDGFKSRRKDFFVINNVVPFANASANTKLSASVAMMGMLLRQSPLAGNSSTEKITQIATANAKNEYVAEFIQLVNTYAQISSR